MAQAELLFIPSSQRDHFLLTIELAKHIVQTNHNISIYVIIYHMPNESTKTQAWIDFFLREVVLDRITFINLPRLSNQQDSSSYDFFPTPIHRQKPLIKRAIVDRQLQPSAIVVDLISISMTDVAKELQIPFYIYLTSGPAYLNTLFQLQSLAEEQGIDRFTELVSNPNTPLDLIGFHNPIPIKVLPRRDLDMPLAMIHLAREFRAAKGILVNTFIELEPLTIEALRDQDNNIPTIYPVGPILALEQYDENDEDEDVIMGWLDEQPKSSVVFLSFGSDGCFDVHQVIEIINGLDQSGYGFLLTIRLPRPEGLIDRTAHKGKIVSWAPQVKVLAHQAVRGFVSHCEWSSILKSIWFGIPIATWPMSSEQQLNAFTLVEELGLATNISLDYRWDYKKQRGNIVVTSDVIEKGVKILMTMSSVGNMRVKLREMSHTSRNVLQPNGGSSYTWLVNFVNEIIDNVNLN